MASVAPPKPVYRPPLPAHLVSEGVLSDAQLDSTIYAGEPHAGHPPGAWTVDAPRDVVGAASDDAERAVQVRRGGLLAGGTGPGTRRPVAVRRPPRGEKRGK